MSRPDDDSLDPRFTAGVDLLRRCGADHFQIGYSDEMDQTVWMALAVWDGERRAEMKGSKVGAGFTPTQALFALLDDVVDGGQCQHCGRPSGFSPDIEPQLDQMLGVAFVCWYKWDPELLTFRRDCEGSQQP